MERVPVKCRVDMGIDYFRPMRIKYEDEAGAHIINIDRIITKDKRQIIPSKYIAPELEYTFKCETIQEDMQRPLTLTFNNQTCIWYMYTN